MEKEQLGFKREKIKVKQVLGLFIKLILLMILFIACFCVVYGVGEYSSYSFSHYTRLQTFLISLTIMLVFSPFVYLLYKVKKFKDQRINMVYNISVLINTAILIQVFAFIV